jgi:outer membrane biogenesis lipoprotein LolB
MKRFLLALTLVLLAGCSSQEAEPPQVSKQEDCERRAIHTAQVLAKSYGGDTTITPRARQDAKTFCQQMLAR